MHVYTYDLLPKPQELYESVSTLAICLDHPNVALKPHQGSHLSSLLKQAEELSSSSSVETPSEPMGEDKDSGSIL